MEYKDYYKIMGLARNATAEEVKRAYRKLSRQFHPDISKEKNAEARFKEIGEAYEVLKDPEKRAAYDQLGANWKAGQDFRPPPKWNTGAEHAGRGFEWEFRTGGPGAESDYSDFFETLFRRGFGSGAGGPGHASAGRGHAAFRAKGQDHHAKIQIDLEDAYHGATRMVNLQVSQADGRGQATARQHQITFNVPKGIRAGQRIRLSGQGTPGTGGGAPGDLYLEVEFSPHPLYRVDKHDVYLDLPVAPWEAALGAQVHAPTPTGDVELKIPPGSASGRKLRLKGRGLPGATPGDFYFVLQITLPPADTDSARAFYDSMARQFKAFHPRARLGGGNK
jgi:curved DNA-binding protein